MYHAEVTDPFYSSEAVDRQDYYSAYTTPITYFDGGSVAYFGIDTGTVYPAFRHVVTTRLGVSSPLLFSLERTYDQTADTGRVTATLENTTGSPVTGTLHFALIENDIPHSWYNESEVNFALRDMLPDASGESVTVAPSDTIIRSRSFSVLKGWNEDNCKIVVFVQAADTAIYQGGEIAVILEPEMEYYGMAPSETWGNGNGFAEPGESMKMMISAKNLYDGYYAGIPVVSTSDPYITITSSSGTPLSIGPGDVDTIMDVYFDISPGCPDPHQVTFLLNFGSTVDTIPFLITTQPGISDDIESGQGGWTHTGTKDGWHITDHKSYSPTHSWYNGIEGTWKYTNKNDAWLISPYFAVTPDSTLSLYNQYDLETDVDYGYIEIDNGSNWWKTLSEITGRQSTWTQALYGLSNYNGQTVRIRFRFISSKTDTAEGWYIDDFELPTNIYVDTVPPIAPYMTQVEKSGTNAEFTWNKVIKDTLNQVENMNYYVVYRNTSPSFIPGPSDSIGVVLHPDTVYVDSSVLDSTETYYYLVKAVDWGIGRSEKSNMGYAFLRLLNENPGPTADRNWVALPYNSEYDSVKDVTTDLSPSGIPISKITRLDVETQNLYSWIYHVVLGWYGNDPGYPGNNFPIELGVAYEFIATADSQVIFAGSNEPDSSVVLNENPGPTADRNWISIPYNAVYDSVKDITDDLSPTGSAVIKITRLDEPTQLYYSWIYHPILQWYGNDPVHPNFPIEPGKGYEFVAAKDTTWNPVEHTNEAKSVSIVRRSRQIANVEIYAGQLLEPDREPVWSVTESRSRADYLNAGAYTLATSHRERVLGDEPGISHLVSVDLELEGFDGFTFTAYRPHLPYDVLTENMAGCVVAKHGDSYCLLSFDVGNFRQAWKSGEEVVLIIEAQKRGRGYCAVVNFALDDGVDIQQLDEISLVQIPKVVAHKGVVRWERLENDIIVGYSVYNEEMRLNHEVITGEEYRTLAEVDIRPVIRGGYETVYGSHASQSTPDTETPLSFSFTLSPNPFTTQTRIEYAVPQETNVDLVVYDVMGRRVKTLTNGQHKPGYYSTVWNGRDSHGREVSSGVYFMQFEASEFSFQEKVLLMR